MTEVLARALPRRLLTPSLLPLPHPYPHPPLPSLEAAGTAALRRPPVPETLQLNTITLPQDTLLMAPRRHGTFFSALRSQPGAPRAPAGGQSRGLFAAFSSERSDPSPYRKAAPVQRPTGARRRWRQMAATCGQAGRSASRRPGRAGPGRRGGGGGRKQEAASAHAELGRAAPRPAAQSRRRLLPPGAGAWPVLPCRCAGKWHPLPSSCLAAGGGAPSPGSRGRPGLLGGRTRESRGLRGEAGSPDSAPRPGRWAGGRGA